MVDFHAACVVDQLSAILYAVPNGEKRDDVVAARLIGNRMTESRRRRMKAERGFTLPEPTLAEWAKPCGQGVLPGVSDLVLLTAGPRSDYCEVKVPRDALREAGRSSKDQKRFREAIEALGFTYHILRSIEDYAALLRNREVALRTGPLGGVVKTPSPVAAPFKVQRQNVPPPPFPTASKEPA